MKTFKELGIKSDKSSFVGEKISVKKILNVEIEIHDYKKGPSKHYNGQTCIQLQIKHGDDMRVVFLQGTKLEDLLGSVAKEDFPFKVTLIRENEWYDFK